MPQILINFFLPDSFPIYFFFLIPNQDLKGNDKAAYLVIFPFQHYITTSNFQFEWLTLRQNKSSRLYEKMEKEKMSDFSLL